VSLVVSVVSALAPKVSGAGRSGGTGSATTALASKLSAWATAKEYLSDWSNSLASASGEEVDLVMT